MHIYVYIEWSVAFALSRINQMKWRQQQEHQQIQTNNKRHEWQTQYSLSWSVSMYVFARSSDNVKRNHYKFLEWNAIAFIFIFNAIFWTFYVIFVSKCRKIDRSLNFSPLIIVLRNFFTYTCFWNDIFYFYANSKRKKKKKQKHVHEENEREIERGFSKQPFSCNSDEINKQNGAS